MTNLRKLCAAVGSLTLLVGVAYLVKEHNDESSKEIVKSLEDKPETKALPKFKFDDIFSSAFSYSSISPIWISGTEYIFRDSVGIKKRNVVTDVVDTLMPGSVYTENGARSYKVSSTQEYILLLTNYLKGWRHSYNGTYIVFDVAAQSLRNDITLPDDTQYITWAPSGNALAYVHDFNIYYRATPNDTDVKITDTGRANYVYNGIPDWVYEEEMISSNNVMYFGPDGQHLAFAQFNDTECDHIEFSRFDGQTYPRMVDVSYPKAGTTQPTNKVFIVDTATSISTEIYPPAELSSSDYLFSRVTWASPTRVMITWCDRLQTSTVMIMCDLGPVNNWVCSKVFDHQTPNGWLFQRRPYWIPVFGQNLDEFFMVLPNNDWQHLARVDSTNVKTFLTEGEYTVTSYSASYPAIEMYDATNDYAYFLSTYDGTEARQIYRKKGHPGAGQTATDAPECITCKVKTKYDGRCNFVSPSFSTNGSYLVLGCRGEGPPLYIQFRVDHTATDPDLVLADELVLVANQDLVDTVNATQMPTKRYGWIDSTTGYKFQYEEWLPPNFDDTKQYPMLIDVYAGPGYQNVDAYWTRSWAPVYVPSGLDVVVVRIDGRGSNFHGDLFMHEVYQNLGQKEIDDQIEAARVFGAKSYIDSSRIAIWGWSYGGFATSHALGQGTDILKCGLAVAPLTDWRYYDTIYAERYMGLPQDNTDGYDKANVMNKAANFPQSSYYLIHGMADDNVHFQNAAQLSKALIDNDIDFSNFYYADQDHSINSGPNTSRHVYQMLTKNLCRCFGIPVPADVWQ